MTTRDTRPTIPALYVATVFLGAMLGFQIQPLVSSSILPWFGGSPAVWTVCLLFFQSALFAGYYYAFRLIRWLGMRGQVIIHAGLLAVALFVPVLPSASWRPQGDEQPAGRILWLLACHTGLPFLLLSATGPLLQVWFLRAFPGKSPYRLYAWSNAGSFVGLVSVPFVLQVWLSLSQQAAFWYGGFVVFSVLTLLCAMITFRAGKQTAEHSDPIASSRRGSDLPQGDGSTRRPSRTPRRIRRLWFLLAMIPTIMLAAVTSKLSMDVSPVPFLWVVPLTIYLASLVVCFARESLAARRVWLPILWVLLLASGTLICVQNNLWGFASLPLQFSIHLGTLAAVCMVCHGELIRLKPHVTDGNDLNDRLLTDFYLVMSLGGAAGGLFTAIIAPLAFPFYLEHHLGLFASAFVPELVPRHAEQANSRGIPHRRRRILAGISVVLLASLLVFDAATTVRSSYSIARSFFGVSRVVERRVPGRPLPVAYELLHGATRHGFQFVDENLARFPTTYYGPTSGVGIAMQSHHASRSRRIGFVGLGVGTLAAYGKAGDAFDFYEIDPVVRELAGNFFRYLGDSPASVSVIPGDARLALENRRADTPYDLLVLDAFSSDAVPIHLLTSEAFDIYRRHLAEDALVAVHISSQNFDLRPVLSGQARRLNWSAICVVDPTFNPARMTVPSFWILMSPSKSVLESPEISRATTSAMTGSVEWTDGRHSLFRVLGHPSM